MATITRFKDGQFLPWEAPSWWASSFGSPNGYPEDTGPDGCKRFASWGDALDGAHAYRCPAGLVVVFDTCDRSFDVWCSSEADFLALATGPLKGWLDLMALRR